MKEPVRKEWQAFIHDGDKYLKAATNGAEKRRSVFTPDLLYNIVSMAIEKHIMGYLLFHNCLPDNHTLIDLIDTLKDVGQVDEDLYSRVIQMGRFQEICALSTYHREEPGEDDISEFLDIGKQIQSLVADQLAASAFLRKQAMGTSG